MTGCEIHLYKYLHPMNVWHILLYTLQLIMFTDFAKQLKSSHPNNAETVSISLG